jgi:hypothetical protein
MMERGRLLCRVPSLSAAAHIKTGRQRESERFLLKHIFT